MAYFYWRGQNYTVMGGEQSRIRGISAFDFNEPKNWVQFTILENCEEWKKWKYEQSGSIPSAVFVSPTRGFGIENLGSTCIDPATGLETSCDESDAVRSIGWGWEGDNDICRCYGNPGPSGEEICDGSRSYRAPGPGDIVFVADDLPMAQTPLLFGGFIGGSTGGVWPCGRYENNNDITQGCTNAVGTTYDSSLEALYLGGIQLDHPYFNYPWGRMGGGFTSGSEKYPTQSIAFWEYMFTGGTYEDCPWNPDLNDYDCSEGSRTIYRSVPMFNITWANEDLSARTQSLRIKADDIQEGARSAIDIEDGRLFIYDLEVVDNLKVGSNKDKSTYNYIATDYERYSRGVVSWVSGKFRSILNKGSDETRFLGTPQQIGYIPALNTLTMDNATVGWVQTYISDPVILNYNSKAGSLFITDNVQNPEEGANYILTPNLTHEIRGMVRKDEVATSLGLSGSEEAANLTSTVKIEAKTGSFKIGEGELYGDFPGSVILKVGNQSDVAGATTMIDKIDIKITDTGGIQSNPGNRPVEMKFTGKSLVWIGELKADWTRVTTDTFITNNNNLVIQTFKLGNKCWFSPTDQFSNWYFGYRNAEDPATFLGGLEFTQEGDISSGDNTCVINLTQTMQIHSASAGLIAPAGALRNKPPKTISAERTALPTVIENLDDFAVKKD